MWCFLLNGHSEKTGDTACGLGIEDIVTGLTGWDDFLATRLCSYRAKR